MPWFLHCIPVLAFQHETRAKPRQFTTQKTDIHVAKTALLIELAHLARLMHIVLTLSVTQAQVPLCSCFDFNRKSFENAGSQSADIQRVLAEFKMGITELADSSRRSHLSQC